jgi:hypothetical protein
MKQLQQLRNLLVHNGGIPDTDQDLKHANTLTEAMNGVEVSEVGIDLSPSAIRYAFDMTDEFMQSLHNAIASMCEHVKKFDNET